MTLRDAKRAINQEIEKELKSEGIDVPGYVLSWLETVLWDVFRHYTAGRDDDKYKRDIHNLVDHACVMGHRLDRDVHRVEHFFHHLFHRHHHHHHHHHHRW